MGRIRHRQLTKSVQGSANKYGTAPTVGRNSFALRLFSIKDVPSKTDARASAAVAAAILAWVLKQELSLGIDGSANDGFGYSVALDGTRALVGVPGRDDVANNQGAAYIFDYNGTTWVQTTELSLGIDGSANDQFGYSVALDGNRALVGADGRDGTKGAAYIYDLSGGNWSLTTDISLVDGSANDYFGWSVALDGNRALVGAYRRDGVATNQGAAYIYDLSGTTWVQTTELSLGIDGSANDGFGYSVALDGTRALVGVPGRDDVANNQGAAYIFDYNGTTWVQTTELSLGIDGSANDQFGFSVALDGNRALVGAYRRDGVATDQGAAYIYDLSGGNWTPTADISLVYGSADDYFGFSVALDRNRALVGARGRDGGLNGKGAAYIYDYNGTNWVQTADISLGPVGIANDYFGVSVALNGNRALVGAYGRDGGGLNGKGAAYIYDYERTN